MAEAVRAQAPAKLGATERRDAWWLAPLATALGFGIFIVYTTFRAFYNAHYEHENLLSPFYSPLLIWDDMPSWLSPAFFILWAPGGFRFTCYYYRKAYYRSYFLDPPGCAVGEGRKSYDGETKLFIFQNVHRFFMYVAVLFIFILGYDALQACVWPDGFGVSVGTLILSANVVFLACYTFGCHSLRHLVGGRIDCFSCAKGGRARHKIWKGVSILNKHHMLWAWLSLVVVGLADLYVWMVASGRISDFRIF